MSSYVLVFGHHFFAVSGADGRYTISEVPAGTYSVAVWSELGTTPPRRITVPDAGVVEANFQVSREP
jgi:hypothetical protein